MEIFHDKSNDNRIKKIEREKWNRVKTSENVEKQSHKLPEWNCEENKRNGWCVWIMNAFESNQIESEKLKNWQDNYEWNDFAFLVLKCILQLF